MNGHNQGGPIDLSQLQQPTHIVSQASALTRRIDAGGLTKLEGDKRELFWDGEELVEEIVRRVTAALRPSIVTGQELRHIIREELAKAPPA